MPRISRNNLKSKIGLKCRKSLGLHFRRAMCMEYVPAMKINDLSGIKAMNIDPDRMARLTVEALSSTSLKIWRFSRGIRTQGTLPWIIKIQKAKVDWSFTITG